MAVVVRNTPRTDAELVNALGAFGVATVHEPKDASDCFIRASVRSIAPFASRATLSPAKLRRETTGPSTWPWNRHSPVTS